MIQPECLRLEKQHGEKHENYQGNYLLDYFQLHKRKRPAEVFETYYVGRNLKAIFKKSHEPACHYYCKQPPFREQFGCIEFKMAIPCQCHKTVGYKQQ